MSYIPLNYFAGFTACTEAELVKFHVLQAIVWVAFFGLSLFYIYSAYKTDKALQRAGFIAAIPASLFGAFIIYTLFTLALSLCSGSPSLFDVSF